MRDEDAAQFGHCQSVWVEVWLKVLHLGIWGCRHDVQIASGAQMEEDIFTRSVKWCALEQSIRRKVRCL